MVRYSFHFHEQLLILKTAPPPLSLPEQAKSHEFPLQRRRGREISKVGRSPWKKTTLANGAPVGEMEKSEHGLFFSASRSMSVTKVAPMITKALRRSTHPDHGTDEEPGRRGVCSRQTKTPLDMSLDGAQLFERKRLVMEDLADLSSETTTRR